MICKRCSGSGYVGDDVSNICDCAAGNSTAAALADQQAFMRNKALASQVAYLGTTGLCFLTLGGTDYTFNAAGIEAAARDMGWAK